MAQDLVALMDALGVDRFGVCGHDRGGRVAHRLAVDHPARVSVTGQAMPTGHFIAEELPQETARTLRDFFAAA